MGVDQEETFSIFESNCHLLLHQSNPFKIEEIPLSALPNGTTSELAGLSSHYPFNAERQVGSC